MQTPIQTTQRSGAYPPGAKCTRIVNDMKENLPKLEGTLDTFVAKFGRDAMPVFMELAKLVSRCTPTELAEELGQLESHMQKIDLFVSASAGQKAELLSDVISGQKHSHHYYTHSEEFRKKWIVLCREIKEVIDGKVLQRRHTVSIPEHLLRSHECIVPAAPAAAKSTVTIAAPVQRPAPSIAVDTQGRISIKSSPRLLSVVPGQRVSIEDLRRKAVVLDLSGRSKETAQEALPF